MLTRLDVSDDSIIACLHACFGLRISQVTFLPIGYADSAVYQVTTDDDTPYFLKLRRGDFNDVAVTVPAFLHAQGIRSVMAPIATTAGRLWARAHGFVWLLYPFFEGRSGFEVALSHAQWIALGKTMKAVHTTRLPAGLTERVPREDYTPRWRDIAKAYHQRVEHSVCPDPVAASFAAFWTTERDEIEGIVGRAEQLAQALQSRAVDLVLCHNDLHGGNVLVGGNGELAIVDWDDPILAPRERDLMHMGGGVGSVGKQARETAWFYEGYGDTAIDPVALAYYRYERIVADIAVYAEQISGVQGSVEDRENGLRWLMRQFIPNGVVEIAHGSYPWPA